MGRPLEGPSIRRAAHWKGLPLVGLKLVGLTLVGYISRAYISRAYISRAYIRRAYISRAYISRAYIRRAVYYKGQSLEVPFIRRAFNSRPSVDFSTVHLIDATENNWTSP